MTNKQGKYIGYQQVAEMIGLPIGTIYSMVSRKQIPHVRLGKRIVRFESESISKWINGRSVPANSSRTRAST